MTEYRALYVAEYGDREEPFATAGLTDDGLLAPEDWDIGLQESFQVKQFDLQYSGNKGWTSALAAEEIDISVYITASRIAFWSPKYDKGSRWVGGGVAGLAVALTANAISAAVAARRRRGKALIGHIRYEWLSAVAFKDKKFLSDKEIRLVYKDSDSTKWALDLVLPRRVDAMATAQWVTASAARYRLAMADQKDPEETDALVALLSPSPLVPEGRDFAVYGFPTFYNAPFGGRKARPAPSALSQPPGYPPLIGTPDAAPPAAADVASPDAAPPAAANVPPAAVPPAPAAAQPAYPPDWPAQPPYQPQPAYPPQPPDQPAYPPQRPDQPAYPPDQPDPEALVTMPFCPGCGQPTVAGSVFCGQCGAPVRANRPAERIAP
ncbi:MAG: zinc ribbon domain-containing protein [Bifidobacteriaceae bacterium]|jgi:hypothetical protein|nr:zinc ribbon domain-containing protein [Bifidobacteriaceae bacterium]